MNSNTRVADIRSELASITQRLHRDDWARPSGQVQADLDAERRSPRFSETRECTAAMAPSARAYCAGLDRLRGELAAAERAEQLRSRETELRTELKALGAGPVPVGEDLTMIAAMTGLDQKALTWWIAVLLAVTLEVAALTVPVLVSAALAPVAPSASAPLRPGAATATTSPKRLKQKVSPPPPAAKVTAANVLTFRRPTASSPSAPGGDTNAPHGSLAVSMEASNFAPPVASATLPDVNAEASPEEAAHIASFIVGSLVEDRASSITGAALREAYEMHCASCNASPLDRNRFGILMSRRFEKQKRRGVMVYFGIRAADAASTSAA